MSRALILAALLAGPAGAGCGVCETLPEPMARAVMPSSLSDLTAWHEGDRIVVRLFNGLDGNLQVAGVLDVGGVQVPWAIDRDYNPRPDRIDVTPPVGWWCDPCALTVFEETVAEIILLPLVGS